ncbi:efflux RND transporter periplasmic adaptor subunit [Azotosporobacter soli]|uniref:efflux RND transporter periplasmic adaptor subunit n=1 Tax=Azotosporobacter soli TaxID=3055040 RepID=UPI0031FE7CC4
MKREKIWRWAAALLCVGALTAGGFFYYQSKNNAASVETKTTAVSRADIQATVAATGTIAALNSVEISSRVTGLIRELKVQENERVKAGQVVVVLDDSTLRAQIAQYQAQLDNYAAIYERSKKLSAAGAQAAQQLETDRTNYLVAKANYDNFALQLDYYIITSPLDGVVVGKPTPAGQTVAQGISTPQVIMTIADMSKMQIKVSVDETDIGKVKVGQSVSFTVDSYSDRTFQGRVSSISKEATTTSNVVYYKVYVDVDAADDLLYPGMTARATIQINERKAVLTVPLTAIKDVKGKRCVQVMQDGKIETVEIKTGLSDDEKTEVISGLQEGDQIVLPTSKTKTSNNQMQGPPPM